jgi:hypothetical protein
VTDVFIHKMPRGDFSEQEREALTAVFRKWYGLVSNHYYR